MQTKKVESHISKALEACRAEIEQIGSDYLIGGLSESVRSSGRGMQWYFDPRGGGKPVYVRKRSLKDYQRQVSNGDRLARLKQYAIALELMQEGCNIRVSRVR